MKNWVAGRNKLKMTVTHFVMVGKKLPGGLGVFTKCDKRAVPVINVQQQNHLYSCDTECTLTIKKMYEVIAECSCFTLLWTFVPQTWKRWTYYYTGNINLSVLWSSKSWNNNKQPSKWLMSMRNPKLLSGWLPEMLVYLSSYRGASVFAFRLWGNHMSWEITQLYIKTTNRSQAHLSAILACMCKVWQQQEWFKKC